MLNSITISNFKAIKDKELKLSNLANVNYFVGKNGSGKSSILEFINNLNNNFKVNPRNNKAYHSYTLTDELATIKTTFSINEEFNKSKISRIRENEILKISYFDRELQEGEYELIDIYNDVIQKGPISNIKSRLINNKTVLKKEDLEYLKQLLTTEFESINSDIIIKLIEETQELIYSGIEINVNRMSSGLKWIVKLIPNFYRRGMATDGLDRSYDIILIEEPENNLHPEFQKLIPKFLSIANSCKKFIVTTHSPFIISAAARERNQKVYLIEDGQCKKEDGYLGYEVKEIANEELGASWEDFNYKKYIICEGEPLNANSDDKLYNLIFQPKTDCKFISMQGYTAVKSKVQAKAVMDLVFGDNKFELFAFFDKDTGKEKIISDLKLKGIESKQTNRREIECYLYCEEVIKRYNELNKNSIQLELNHDITIELSKHCQDYWDKIKSLVNIPKELFEVELGKLINEKDTPNIYKELHDCIFT